MCEKKRICQVQESFTTKICFGGNSFRNAGTKFWYSWLKRQLEKSFFYCTVHTANEKVGIPDEISVKEVAR